MQFLKHTKDLLALVLCISGLTLASAHLGADESKGVNPSTKLTPAQCEQRQRLGANLTKKGNFYYEKAYRLNDRIARTFADNESRFITQSHSSFKLYDYELAIYNFGEALKAYIKAEEHFIEIKQGCNYDSQQQARDKLKALRVTRIDAQDNLYYFQCQYAIDQSQKALTKSEKLKSNNNFFESQKYADQTRQTLVAHTSDDSRCSTEQKRVASALYQQAWDVIAATNKPIEQQFYCQNQLTSIGLKLKDADIALAAKNRKKAHKLRKAAGIQIDKLLKSEACPDDSVKWLKQKKRFIIKSLK